MKRVKSGYVPAWWATVRLSDRAHRIGIALWSYADDFGHCFPSISTLAKATGLHRRNVSRALDDLVRADLLSVKPGDREHANHYWLTLIQGEVALRRVAVQEPLGVAAVDEGEGSGPPTAITPNKLPYRTTVKKERRGEDGLTNEERVDAYLAANVVAEPGVRPGDDFFAVARKRWPGRFKESEVA